jgi:hypothetical protein
VAVSPSPQEGKSPELQSSREEAYKVVTRINYVVYRIQRNFRSRLMVLHLDRLTHIMEPLGTSYLKNRAMGAVGE